MNSSRKVLCYFTTDGKRRSHSWSRKFKQTTTAYLFSAALATGLMFSVDRLTFLGNSLGIAGPTALLALAGGILVHVGTLLSYRALLSTAEGPDRRMLTLAAVYGRLPLAVCASTGMLVSAGFVFNEVFVYWFPNFAFAFLLLAAVVGANLLPLRRLQYTQVVSVALASAGMLSLIVVGLLKPPVLGTISVQAPDFDYRHLGAGIVLLFGFDMARNTQEEPRYESRRLLKAMLFALIAGGLLLISWGVVGLKQAPLHKLAQSTLPHMIVARAILGQTGRMVMGAVVILGVFGAVNALFFSVSRMTGNLALSNAVDMGAGASRKLALITLGLLAVATASMMAMGLAGEPRLETFIQASIALWLIHYGIVNLMALRRRPAGALGWAFGLPLKGIAACATVLAAGDMLRSAGEPETILFFLAGVPAGLFCLMAALKYATCRKNGP